MFASHYYASLGYGDAPRGTRYCPECDGSGRVDNPEYDPKDDDTRPLVDCEGCDGEGVMSKRSHND